MAARFVCTFTTRLIAALASAVVLLGISTIGPGTPVHAARADYENTTMRGLELQGHLAGDGDEHFLGLEPEKGARSIVLTLIYRAPMAALVHDGVSFSVLAQDGLRAYFTGTPLDEVATVQGSVFTAGPDGTIVQATLKVDGSSGYTVVVHNSWYDSINYGLTVHGGALVDEGGQTLLLVPAPEDVPAPPLAPEPLQQPVLVDGSPAQAAAQDLAIATRDAPAPVVSEPFGARHFYELKPSGPDGEVNVRLLYDTVVGGAPLGGLSFWVLTMDGLHHVIQGALLEELYLASGRPATAGELSATVRLGGADTYALVVINETGRAASFRLSVHGAQLTAVDLYGGFEITAEFGPFVPQTPADGGVMALAQP